MTTVSAASLGLTEFRTGDIFCGDGVSGGIEVFGTSNTRQRDLVPSRLNGTEFVIPVLRANPQAIYVQCLGGAAVVSLRIYINGTDTLDQVLYLGPHEAGSFTTQAAQTSVRVTATAPILVTIASAVGGAVGTPPLTGAVDYMPVPPTAGTVYGFPQRGFLATFVQGFVNLSCVNSLGNTTHEPLVIPAGQWAQATINSTA